MIKIVLSGKSISMICCLILLSASYLCLAGCSAPYPNSPDKVFATFIIAFKDQDMETAEKYCTEDFRNRGFSVLKGLINMLPKSEKKEGQKKPTKEDIEKYTANLSTTIEGDKAKISFSKVGIISFVLIKEGGKWKVDGVEQEVVPKNLTDLIENMRGRQDAPK